MIKIICVGKIKEKYFRDAIDEYSKRISKYTNLEIIELQDEKTDDKTVALRKEAKQIIDHINDKDYIVTLEIESNQMNSIEFSNFLDKTFISNPNITFIIGGSFGLDNLIKEKSNQKISFSKMTFPHQLFRIILLEQIYRAYRINNNESYHK